MEFILIKFKNNCVLVLTFPNMISDQNVLVFLVNFSHQINSLKCIFFSMCEKLSAREIVAGYFIRVLWNEVD